MLTACGSLSTPWGKEGDVIQQAEIVQLKHLRAAADEKAEQERMTKLYERARDGDPEAVAELKAYHEQEQTEDRARYAATMPARLVTRAQMLEEIRAATKALDGLDWHKSNTVLASLEKAVRALRMGDQALVQYKRSQGHGGVQSYLIYHLPPPAGWLRPWEADLLDLGHRWVPPEEQPPDVRERIERAMAAYRRPTGAGPAAEPPEQLELPDAKA